MLVIRGDGVDQGSPMVDAEALWELGGAVAVLGCDGWCALGDGQASAGGGFEGEGAAEDVGLDCAVGFTGRAQSHGTWEMASVKKTRRRTDDHGGVDDRRQGETRHCDTFVAPGNREASSSNSTSSPIIVIIVSSFLLLLSMNNNNLGLGYHGLGAV